MSRRKRGDVLRSWRPRKLSRHRRGIARRLFHRGRAARTGRRPAAALSSPRGRVLLSAGGQRYFQADGKTIHAKPGDFIHIPRGVVHSIKNEGTQPARALVVISPAGPTGMQQFFEESFTPTTDCNAPPPPITEELMKRMMASAAKNGVEWIKPA